MWLLGLHLPSKSGVWSCTFSYSESTPWGLSSQGSRYHFLLTPRVNRDSSRSDKDKIGVRPSLSC